ncbi:MAG: BRCT domain-containing protein [Burkholderiaceae bacterium]|nr:BRCT domain-containing protein [Burkholderiaceae bacterium]
MHPDLKPYVHFTGRARLDKAVNSLLGLLEGIAIDREINPAERGFLRLWLADHEELRARHPFNELIPLVEAAVEDGVLTSEEHDDIVWFCERLQSAEYYDRTTADLQQLHGVLGGIVADGVISEDELRGLSDWLEEHDHLKTCWPYDEVSSLITQVLRDKKIDEQEHRLLKDFFSEFVAVLDDRTIVNPPVAEGLTIVGLCAVCPEIEFEGAHFCFTGTSSRHTKSELTALVTRLGGTVSGTLTQKVRYLVIGADGNPCWAYACYGRKVEKAVELRKAGVRVLLVHENDFHDAVADRG